MPGEDGVNNSYERIKTIVVSVNANIRSLDFSEDCKLLRTSNTANQILYWSVEETGPDDDISGAPVKDTGALADVVWATWGSALGWQVEGMYETGQYGLHSRTSALASREQHLLVAWQDKVLTLLALLVHKVRNLLAFLVQSSVCFSRGWTRCSLYLLFLVQKHKY